MIVFGWCDKVWRLVEFYWRGFGFVGFGVGGFFGWIRRSGFFSY